MVAVVVLQRNSMSVNGYNSDVVDNDLQHPCSMAGRGNMGIRDLGSTINGSCSYIPSLVITVSRHLHTIVTQGLHSMVGRTRALSLRALSSTFRPNLVPGRRLAHCPSTLMQRRLFLPTPVRAAPHPCAMPADKESRDVCCFECP